MSSLTFLDISIREQRLAGASYLIVGRLPLARPQIEARLRELGAEIVSQPAAGVTVLHGSLPEPARSHSDIVRQANELNLVFIDWNDLAWAFPSGR